MEPTIPFPVVMRPRLKIHIPFRQNANCPLSTNFSFNQYHEARHTVSEQEANPHNPHAWDQMCHTVGLLWSCNGLCLCKLCWPHLSTRTLSWHDSTAAYQTKGVWKLIACIDLQRLLSFCILVSIYPLGILTIFVHYIMRVGVKRFQSYKSPCDLLYSSGAQCCSWRAKVLQSLAPTLIKYTSARYSSFSEVETSSCIGENIHIMFKESFFISISVFIF